MAISTLKKLIAKRYLQRGDGILSMPERRRRKRLLGQHATGRTSRPSLGVKLEKLFGVGAAELNRATRASSLKAFASGSSPATLRLTRYRRARGPETTEVRASSASRTLVVEPPGDA